MAGRETTPLGKKLRGSIGAGIGALTSGGRDYYVLEHKTASKRFKAGTQKEIIVDYLELGRDRRCGVRFSEDDSTVSRKHAAISKDGDSWVIHNLSKTNPTLLNGRPVNKAWYLKSGDEIQLSLEGPVLGFIVPSNNKTGTLTIGKRMTLFGQQALRPYKQAIYALATALLIITAGSIYAITTLRSENIDLHAVVIETKENLASQDTLTSQQAQEIAEANQKLASAEDREAELNSRIKSMRRSSRKSSSRGSTAQRNNTSSNASSTSTAPTELSSLYDDIYYVTVSNIVIEKSDGERLEAEDLEWSGTGFLTQDNKFVTARHVVEPWFFPTEDDENLLLINLLVNNYGGRVTGKMKAVSPSGHVLNFKLEKFDVNRSLDIAKSVDIDGEAHVVRHALQSPFDIASISAGRVGRLEINRELSENLQSSQELIILGYPLGVGARSGDISPLYSTTTVAGSGLVESVIYTSDSNFDHGNSGGPVFVLRDGKYIVIGVVSAMYGNTLGRIIPISYL